MQRRRLGHSNLYVSEIGLGGMSLSAEDRLQSTHVIQQAFESGINYIDTADLYDHGQNESLIGEAVSDFRKDIILATKVGNQWRPSVTGWDWNPSKSHILSAVEQSLKRLRTDYIDLYQLHGGTQDDSFEEVLESFELLVEQGKIRYYGISSIRPNVFAKYATESQIVSNMMQYSILDRRPEEYLSFFEKHEVGIVVRGGLAQGVFVDKSAKEYLTYDKQSVDALLSLVDQEAKGLSLSRQSLALAYVLQSKAVSSVMVGVSSLSQLSALCDSYKKIGNINLKDFINRLNLSYNAIKYTAHR